MYVYALSDDEEEKDAHNHHHGHDRDGDHSSEDSRDHSDSTGDEDRTSYRHNGHEGSHEIVIDIPPGECSADHNTMHLLLLKSFSFH